MSTVTRIRRFFVLLLALPTLAHRAAAKATSTVLNRAGPLLAFATAVLLQLPASIIANPQTTNEQGGYAFSSVKPGRHCIKDRLLSYRSAAFVVADAPVAVPPLRLAPAATALLKQHANRTMLQVARLNAAGETALETIKAASVTLDKDEYGTNVSVMMDGKMR